LDEHRQGGDAHDDERGDDGERERAHLFEDFCQIEAHDDLLLQPLSLKGTRMRRSTAAARPSTRAGVYRQVRTAAMAALTNGSSPCTTSMSETAPSSVMTTRRMTRPWAPFLRASSGKAG